MTTADKLAEALRELLDRASDNWSTVSQVDLDRARAALAEYEREKAELSQPQKKFIISATNNIICLFCGCTPPYHYSSCTSSGHRP